ncbi:MAG: Hpt domain-containing protein [Pseudomonadota bacterium]
MSALTEFDTGPLTWVKGEIDQALQLAREKLAQFAGNTADPTPLRFCSTHLHQVTGAIQMVGLEGTARFSEAAERVVEALDRQEIPPSAQTLELADAALTTLSRYLEGLLNGQPDVPLRLYPIYRSLREASGAEKFSESDLFYPDLTERAPKSPDMPVLDETERIRLVKTERARFQRGLLEWLRGNGEGGLPAMHAALQAIERTQTLPAHRTFWWTMVALIESLMAGGATADPGIKLLCGQIDQQIRRLSEGSPKVAERLLREALYVIARGQPASERIRQAKQIFDLDAYLPQAGEEPRLETEDGFIPLLRELRDTLSAAKEAWLKFSGGSTNSLEKFRTQASVLLEKCAALGNPALQELLRHMRDSAAGLTTDPAESATMEMATALLLVEHALDNFPGLTDEFVNQAEIQGRRLDASFRGDAREIAAGGIPVLDEISRKAQEKVLLAQVGREIQINLQQVEEVLDAFFRDPGRRSELSGLTPLLGQIRGALKILELAEGAALLHECETLIERFASPENAVQQEELELVAEGLSSLGFYVEAVQRGQPDAPQILRPALNRLAAYAGKPPMATDTAIETAAQAEREASLESSLREQKRQIQELLAQWQRKPEDAHLHDTVCKLLAALQRDADLVADPELKAYAADNLRLLESPRPEPEIAAAAPAVVADEAVDAELLETYLEEADEVLAAVAENLEICGADLQNRDALTAIRRSFHTLKGSGRMVGLHALGEVAWGVEQLLNKWLQEEKSATPELLALLTLAHGAFGQWVARLRADGSVEVHAEDLLAQAQRLKEGVVPMVEESPTPPGVGAPAAEQQETEEVLRAAEEAPAAASSVLIGDVTLPAELYRIFMGEASQHLATLAAELERLRLRPDEPIRHDFMRAAHTLCGISRTVGFPVLAELGNALEQWLQEILERPQPATEKHLKVMGDSIAALGKMVQTISGGAMPKPAKQLIRSLQSMLKKAQGAQKKTAAGKTAPAPAAGIPGVTIERRAQPAIRDDIDEALLPVFLEETQELLPLAGAQLRAWRENPADAQTPKNLQRNLHTLKGSARTAGAMRLGELTHTMETLVLAAMKAEEPPADLFDQLETYFDRIGDFLEGLQQAPQASPGIAAPAAFPAPGGKVKAMLRVSADLVDRLVSEAGEVSIARSRLDGEIQGIRRSLLDLTDSVNRLRSQLREIEIQAESQMQARHAQTRETEEIFDPLEFDRFTRLQELTRLMAESVNDVFTVQQSLLKNADEAEAALLQQGRMTKELQQELLRARMVPLASISERLHRMVRQTAKELGKRAMLEIRGGQVEMDRSVLEKMAAPFEHLLRNAVDHGVESEAERIRAGKPNIGAITLEAHQEGNEITLTVNDDGAGLDLAAIRATAARQGMLPAEDEPTAAQLVNLIFTPGFSTAAEITQVSGRGIGMDVVRNEIAGLGGRIEVSSEPGKGTTFRICLPVTLAVTQVVLVRAGNATYAIPAPMVDQVQELKPNALAEAYRQNEIRWQGKRYPLFHLPRLLGNQEQAPAAQLRTPVMLLHSGAQLAAIHVDELAGNREVVAKDIGPQLARVAGVAGATVLGDGRVVLIINPVQLAHRQELPVAAASGIPLEMKPAAAAPLVMVVDDSLTVRKITSRLLAREGYQVVTAKDGVDALQLLQDASPAIMLVDIEMPRMDGFELTKNVRGNPRTAQTPIIMITSRIAEKHRNHALELGVNEYLGKPYQEEELLGHIERLVKQRTVH